jgi:tRNA(Met) cytidine acetyltransferase
LFVSAALARDDALRIAVTASHARGTETLMARVAAGTQTFASRLRAVSAFELAHGKVDVDIVLVDEAAGLSVELLSAIVAHYPRIAFATTVHGYEGSGQGFRVRFMEQLLRTFPRTREVVLDTPVRWAADDPVEAFAARALVLDAAPALATYQAANDAWLDPRPDVAIERVERAQLAANESLLRALFGTFVLAHYRTTPSDLAHLLDDEGVQLWAAREGSEIVGALWAVAEGGLDAQSAVRIAQGQLRPRGHMLPEAFARHLNEVEAAQLRGLRVVRIAVAPAARRCGTASALLAALTRSARSEGFAYLGAGFAATADVVSFWQANQCPVVHIGTKRGAASGEVSALVLRSLSAETEQLVRRLSGRFSGELVDRLRDGLHDLSPDVVACVWERSSLSPYVERSEGYRQRLASYVHHAVPYEAVVSVLHRFVVERANAGAFWPLLAPQALLIAKVLQGRPWSEVRRSFRFASVAEAMRAVRRAIMEEYGEQSEPRSDL